MKKNKKQIIVGNPRRCPNYLQTIKPSFLDEEDEGLPNEQLSEVMEALKPELLETKEWHARCILFGTGFSDIHWLSEKSKRDSELYNAFSYTEESGKFPKWDEIEEKESCRYFLAQTDLPFTIKETDFFNTPEDEK